MRAVRAWSIVALLGCASCADSCGCGSGDGSSAAESAPGDHAASSSAKVVLDGGLPEPPPPAFVDLEDSPLKQQLGAHAQALRSVEITEPIRAASSLLPAAPDELAGFSASEPAKAITKQVGQQALPLVQRSYTREAATLRLRITDSAHMSSLRNTFAQRLMTVGSEATGNQRGRMVDDLVVLRAYHPGRRRSRASMFVAQRFLVEADVKGATDADDAVRVLQAIPVKALSARQ